MWRLIKKPEVPKVIKPYLNVLWWFVRAILLLIMIMVGCSLVNEPNTALVICGVLLLAMAITYIVMQMYETIKERKGERKNV
jgi:ABC-type transport system involved in cytochrome bd biosynthesis fused ATPase/permease subunit